MVWFLYFHVHVFFRFADKPTLAPQCGKFSVISPEICLANGVFFSSFCERFFFVFSFKPLLYSLVLSRFGLCL